MSESDDITRVIRRKPASPTPEDPEKTRAPKKTAGGPPPIPAKPVEDDDDEKTRVYFRAAAAGSGSAKAQPEESSSPTVGWLVVMAGPGRGASMTLGSGMNHMGRSASNRILLDFGDEEISRKTHTTLTFDPRGRKFYLQPGPDATNLTYLGEEPNVQPVLTPTEIFGGETILLGRTKLKFIAFCGPGFAWD